MRFAAVVLIAFAGSGAFASEPGETRVLTFGDRVAAQKAIEQVYRNHRIWPADNPTPKASFEESVPDTVLAAAVKDGLRRVASLLSYWGESVTAADVQAELTRLGSETKDPRTLRELFSALHDDPFVIGETLVRPRLVDRRIRERYAWDDRFHGATRRRVETLVTSADCVDDLATTGSSYVETTWALVADGSIPGHTERDDPSVVPLRPAEWEAKLGELATLFGATGLVEGRLSRVQETAEGFDVVAIVAAGADRVTTATVAWPKRSFDDWWNETRETSGIADTVADTMYSLPSIPTTPCSLDTWSPIAASILDARYRHTAVWTGAEMIVWGGFALYGPTASGARYDPATDTWTPTSMGPNAPTTRNYHSAVWTGQEMIIWGGTRDVAGPSTAVNTGARYDPATDRWTPTSFTGTTSPTPRSMHAAIWTGTQMIVWGGQDRLGNGSNSGDRYTPQTDTWSPMTTTTAPAGRWYHSAVWTGTQMIVWGGRDYWWWSSPGGASGGVYTPSSNTWRPTSVSAVPELRQEHAGAWTGTLMLVWGGYGYPVSAPTDGGRYEPNGNRWTALTTSGAPEGRTGPTTVWTGGEMIVWGGSYLSALNTGGRYDPATDTWRPTSTGAFVPVGRFDHTAVWTGNLMIVWGGQSDVHGNITNSGAAYCACPSNLMVYRDADGDGYGDPAHPLFRCDGSVPSGYSTDGSDCDDSNASAHPGAHETCNAIDDDCNGVVDDGGAALCDDGNPCTDERCLGFFGCAHTNNTAACSDGNACTTADVCHGGACLGGPALDCDDHNVCTDDSCDPATGCIHVDALAGPCDDGNLCTTNDECINGVYTGTAVSCEDHCACTADSCDPATGCVHVTIDCNDHDVCTNDSCDPTLGCQHVPLVCNDHNACTSDDCDPGSGCAYVVVRCDDHDTCTNDSCDPALGCLYTPVVCNDGNACTTDACDSVGGCTATTINCDDGNPCTNDSCNPSTGCVYTNNTSTCDDRNACTSGDFCSGGSCHPGTLVPPPAEVEGVLVSKVGETTLRWTAVSGSVVYDILASGLSDLRSTGAVRARCLANDVQSTSYMDGRAGPGQGDGYYYVIRAQNACGAGSYGSDSTGAVRVLISACP